jgi:hypothetical protein
MRWRPVANNANATGLTTNPQNGSGGTGGCQAQYYAIPPPECTIANDG